jgi:hypothetical protein
LIVLIVVIHILGLGLLSQRADHFFRMIDSRRPAATLVVVTGAATLLVTCLHGIEAAIWAVAYLILGAFPDFKSSMLFSLNAITSYGHTDLSLRGDWRLLGALESLNGWLLFGLTTAFLFAVIQTVWFAGHPRFSGAASFPTAETEHPEPTKTPSVRPKNSRRK